MSAILWWMYLGGIKDATNEKWLRDNGITHILNVAKRCKDIEYPDYIKSLRIPLQDTPTEDIDSVLELGLAYLMIVKMTGGKVLVHCMAGISRSSTFVIYYLMREYGKSLDDALQFCRAQRPQVKPNSGFLNTLYNRQHVPR